VHLIPCHVIRDAKRLIWKSRRVWNQIWFQHRDCSVSPSLRLSHFSLIHFASSAIEPWRPFLLIARTSHRASYHPTLRVCALTETLCSLPSSRKPTQSFQQERRNVAPPPSIMPKMAMTMMTLMIAKVLVALRV
jgi:hypothetical protein